MKGIFKPNFDNPSICMIDAAFSYLQCLANLKLRMHCIMLDMHPLMPESGRLSATSNPASHLKIIHAAAPKWTSLQSAFESFRYQLLPARSVRLSEISQGRVMQDRAVLTCRLSV